MTTTKTTPSELIGMQPIKGIPMQFFKDYVEGRLRVITLPEHCPHQGEHNILDRPLGMNILTRVWVGKRCIVSDCFYSFNNKEEYYFHIQDWLRVEHFIYIRYGDELIIHPQTNNIRDIYIKSSILEKLY